MAGTARQLAPGKHSRKAIYGGVSAAVALTIKSAADGKFTLAEIAGVAGAGLLGYLAVWAGVNGPPKT